ncbi:MAG: electron transport complex subunit RsxG [Agarilytica sp.]
MLGQSISKNSFILGTFALVTAGILAVTFLITKDKIAAAEKKAAKKALSEIVLPDRNNNDMLEDIWPIPEQHFSKLGLDTTTAIHIAKQDDTPVAVVIPSTAPDGYSGDIKLIVGINTDGSVAGVRVLSHKETPGLGDKVDLNKNDWILNFNHKSLNNPELAYWKVKKDGGQFDQFTGATITPRAVVKRVKQTLEYFDSHREEILGSVKSDTEISQ